MADDDCQPPKKLKLDNADSVECTDCEGDATGSQGSEAGSLQCEKDVGITEYASQHEGFTGVIKQRYADFLVSEIDTSGLVVKLTDTSRPEDPTDEKESDVPEDTLTADQMTQLTDLTKSKDTKQHVLLETTDDKDSRTAVHTAIRNAFSCLSSKTIDARGKKCIHVTYGMTQDCRSRKVSWPKHLGDYCHFVLYKENKDTLAAVNYLSKLIRTKSSNFAYAGTKDRRAKTSQLMSVYRIRASRLHALNSTRSSITLGNFRYCKDPLKLGDLQGNHFVIVVRNVCASKEQIASAMTSLKDVGFINYFGMQRFGTTDIPTYDVGREILKSNWQHVVELILKPRKSGKYDRVDAARQVWWKTRDARKALDALRGWACLEKHLLTGLSKFNKNDLVNSIALIPRNMRMLYIHAFQSRIWNLMVSRRIAEFGRKPIVGDLVLTTANNNADVETDELMRCTPTTLTADNLPEYTIYDVVLPLPGFDVIYPANEVGDWYREHLRGEGMEAAEFFQHKIRDYRLAGRYRRLMMKAGDVNWEILTYDDVSISLTTSDLELLSETQPEKPLTDGKFEALKMSFSLPPSTYATMAIREVLKCDTSTPYQSSLNVV